jgi:pteridine reductase
MSLPLEGRVALVTGAARRVGRAIALRLAEEGMDVAITYNRSGDEARVLVREIQNRRRRALAIQADFLNPDAVQRVFESFTEPFDRLDALVNNAAIYEPTPLGKIDPTRFDQHMIVNVRAPLLLAQRFTPLLAANARADDPTSLGRVVNLLDIHAMGRPVKGFAAYSASKAALWDITRTLARELAPNITVNAIAPGVVAWPESTPREQRDQYLSRIPLQRAGTPEDVAAAALYLIREAHYCTGQVIRVDGGRSLV